jgi:hypothetical protein
VHLYPSAVIHNKQILVIRMHYVEFKCLINHLMHTKNWKPLSVNFGASLSLYRYIKNDITYEIQFTTPTYMSIMQTTVTNEKQHSQVNRTFDSEDAAGKVSSEKSLYLRSCQHDLGL